MSEQRKTTLDWAMDALSINKFLREMYKFVLNPAMMDGEWEHAPLKKALRNLIYSLAYVGAFISILSWFLQNSDVVDFPTIINPVGLTLILAMQAIIFAVIFWVIASALTNLKRRGWHHLYFMQVLQTYALINFFVISLFWIALNRIIFTGDSRLAINAWDLSIGGVLAVIVIVLLFRLLIIPVKNYLSQYYRLLTSWLLTIAILLVTFIANAYFHPGVGNRLINAKVFCEYSSSRKAELMSLDIHQKNKITGYCMELMIK